MMMMFQTIILISFLISIHHVYGSDIPSNVGTEFLKNETKNAQNISEDYSERLSVSTHVNVSSEDSIYSEDLATAKNEFITALGADKTSESLEAETVSIMDEKALTSDDQVTAKNEFTHSTLKYDGIVTTPFDISSLQNESSEMFLKTDMVTTVTYMEKQTKSFLIPVEERKGNNEDSNESTLTFGNFRNETVTVEEAEMSNGSLVFILKTSGSSQIDYSMDKNNSQSDGFNASSIEDILPYEQDDSSPNYSKTDTRNEIFESTTFSSDKLEMTPRKQEETSFGLTTSLMEYDDSEDDIVSDTTDVNSNFTRNPKKIQNSENKKTETRDSRPSHPDPTYSKRRPIIDTVRPYRPDVPLHHYPYFRPTPDYRTPSIKENKDQTKPPRPDIEYPRVSFKPNYAYSRPTPEDSSASKSSPDVSASKPYRPSFSRPYHPQSSFGRPYSPEYARPSSKPSDDYSPTQKPTTESKLTHGQEMDISESSRADYDYTKHYEPVSGYTKHYTYQSENKPQQRPDLSKPYRPSNSEILGSSENDHDTVKAQNEKETNKPISFYPRPGFTNNYQPSSTATRPFSIGTITSAKNVTRVEFIKADCFDNHMKVTMRFNGTFSGLVYSSGYAQDSSCSYVNGSGRNHYEFYIRLNRCGTLGQQEVADQRMRSSSRRRQERAQYLVNTVTVQYNPVIEEDIDEHFRVTCEYGYDFWKTVTFPIVNVESSAVKVRTGSPVVFTLPPPQCNMEIRSGFGPSGTRISGPVNVGDPLTLVIHMKSESTGFDILVSNCYAHNGAQKRLQLLDTSGCVVQEKLISPFRGVSSPDRSQQVTLYSYLKAFRFTGSPALYIECDVHMCHGSCPPQRCYWRNLRKRSAEDGESKTTKLESIMSDSVSLFQALEVRHDEADSQNKVSLRRSNRQDVEDVLCMKTGGFAATFAVLLLLLCISTFAAASMCFRMRRMKRLVEAPEAKHFVEFDGHTPMK